MSRNATTVAEYLAGLPEDRRAALEAVRKVIRKNLPKGYEEGMQYGMIGYFVPHSVYPAGYHCDPKQPLPFAGLASQKGHMSLYLCSAYASPEHEAWFRKAWTAGGRRLDMGKACVRFKKLEDVPLEVVGEAVRRMPVKEFVALYEKSRPGGGAANPKKVVKKAGKKTSKKVARKSGTVSKKAGTKAAARGAKSSAR